MQEWLSQKRSDIKSLKRDKRRDELLMRHDCNEERNIDTPVQIVEMRKTQVPVTRARERFSLMCIAVMAKSKQIKRHAIS